MASKSEVQSAHLSVIPTGTHSNDELDDSTAPHSVLESEKDKRFSYPKRPGSDSSKERVEELGKLVTKVDESPALADPDGTYQAQGRRKMRIVKFVFGFGLLGFK
jgi:hypothetical protein